MLQVTSIATMGLFSALWRSQPVTIDFHSKNTMTFHFVYAHSNSVLLLRFISVATVCLIKYLAPSFLRNIIVVHTCFIDGSCMHERGSHVPYTCGCFMSTPTLEATLQLSSSESGHQAGPSIMAWMYKKWEWPGERCYNDYGKVFGKWYCLEGKWHGMLWFAPSAEFGTYMCMYSNSPLNFMMPLLLTLLQFGHEVDLNWKVNI